jgi:hypothetical protein
VAGAQQAVNATAILASLGPSARALPRLRPQLTSTAFQVRLCFLRTAGRFSQRGVWRSAATGQSNRFGLPRSRTRTGVEQNRFVHRSLSLRGERRAHSSYLVIPKDPPNQNAAIRTILSGWRSALSDFPPALTRWQRLRPAFRATFFRVRARAGLRTTRTARGAAICREDRDSRMCRIGECPEFNCQKPQRSQLGDN